MIELVSPARYVLNQSISEIINSHCPQVNASILDIGCGKGYYNYFIKEDIEGRYLGIDINRKDIWDKANTSSGGLQIFFKIHGAEFIDELEGSFNFICAFQSFEHIEDDKKVIENSEKILNKQGVFLITVPSKYSFFLYGVHGLRRYSILSLKKLLRGTSYKIIKIKKVGGLATFFLHFVLWSIPVIFFKVSIWKGYEYLRLNYFIYLLEYSASILDRVAPIFEAGYVFVIGKD